MVKLCAESLNGKIPPIHVVSAWASEQNLVMGQVKTDVKSNEITAIPELLKMLVIKKTLVSIAAMGCQKAIAEHIKSQKADYLLALKRNQLALYDDIALVFEAYDVDMAPHQIFEQEFLDKAHGRIERRIYSLEVRNLEAKTNWPGLRCIGRVGSILEVN